MYMASASPNATYIRPARVGSVGGLALGQGGFELGLQGFTLGLRGFSETCWYWQRKLFALRAGPNAKPQCEWFPVAVEYRLKSIGVVVVKLRDEDVLSPVNSISALERIEF